MNRVTVTVIGFLLMGLGALSLILGMLGLSLSPIVFIDRMTGSLDAFLIKLTMLLLGFVLFYMARIDPEEDAENPSEYEDHKIR